MNVLRGASTATSLAAWFDALARAGGLGPLPPEVVELEHAAGRVTAQTIVARRSSPGFDAAAMDGIAVAAAATAGAPITLAPHAFAPVDTGDPLPAGSDAVVRSEDVVLTDGAALASEALPYANVRQLGEDVAAGELVFRSGRQLSPPDLAVLGSVGTTSVAVRSRPIVAILPSGSEITALGTNPAPGEIIDTNSLMLATMVEEAGGAAIRLPVVPDDLDLLAAALVQAVAEADLVLVVAGSAKGPGDHAAAAIERVGRMIVQGVAVKPGHPVVLGHSGSTPLIGVPGYPVSASLAFELFALPLLAELGGRPRGKRPRARATAAVEIRSAPRSDEWIRLRLARIGTRLVALPLRRGAGVLSSLARADGLACVPLGSDGVAEGEGIDVELLRPLEAIEASLLVTGSTDPILDLLTARLDLLADCDGSANGAASLAARRCHLALLAPGDVPAQALVLGAWDRQLGLIVAAGDPLGIAGVGKLRGREIRLANRQRGSASRRLLDTLLAEASIDPGEVTGYHRESRSHAAAAAAVAAGAVDCAVGTASAAAEHGLDFVPLSTQSLTLVAAADLEDDERIAVIRDELTSAEWRHAVELLGYPTRST